MTCIVAVTDGRTIVIGGDSAGAGGHKIRLRADPKVFRRGRYAIGFTTSYRMGQILRYQAELPDPPRGAEPEELERFMVTEFVPATRRAFADHGFAKTVRFAPPGAADGLTEEGQEVGGLFLVGVAGHIFEIREDYHAARPTTPFSAIGHGAEPALGALFALGLAETTLSLRERARAALEASESLCSSVRAPFHFVELDNGAENGHGG